MSERESYAYPPDLQFGSAAKERQEELDEVGEDQVEASGAAEEDPEAGPSGPRPGNKAEPADTPEQ